MNIKTETPEEAEVFNKMKPYEYNEHVSEAKKPLTVKEFVDLGVKFFYGDKCEMGGREYVFHGNDFSGCFNDAAVTSFVWRPLKLLPISNKFKYECNDDYTKWRPLLDQSVKPDDKLVFTQDMDEFKAGDFVSVLPPKGVRQSKAKFLLIGFDLEGNAIIQHCCSKNISDTCKSRLISPIDTRTPKQKAIDDIEGIVKHMLSANETASDIAIAIVDSKILER